MKKAILGVLALVVPMALVVYTICFNYGLISTVFGCVTMAAMTIYAINKFNFVGKKRGYNSNANALCYASIGSACWSFGYIFLSFVCAKIGDGNADIYRFTPLMAVVVYMCVLGIIACIAHILKKKYIDMDHKALMIFISTFLLCIAISCGAEISKLYGSFVPDTEALSTMLMISLAGIAIAARKHLRYNNREEYA